MIFSILCLLAVVTLVCIIVQTRSDGMPWRLVLSEAGAFLAISLFLSSLLMLISAAISTAVIDPDTGWEVQSETTYTVAEGSEIVVRGNNSIEFVESRDGKLENVELDFIDGLVYVEGSETARTVTVREEHRELGTALVPWGVGDSMTTATIK